MGKILLIGNGLTSQLIPEYKNDCMMNLFAEENRDLLSKANALFSSLRYKVDVVNYTATSAVLGGHPLLRAVVGFSPNPKLIELIKINLQKMGFTNNYQEIFSTFFELYGLLYETQNESISSIESLLKVISLFQTIGAFNDEDARRAHVLSNKIYYNNGAFRGKILPDRVQLQLGQWLDTYQEVYTTNYDMVLDDTYTSPKGVYHLHGGFTYSDRYHKLKEPLRWDEAYLIWGISGEAKMEQMKSEGLSFPISFPMEFKMSIFEDYLKKLQHSDAEQIDIFGYSGENDNHINNAIINNDHIKEVVYYCSPRDATSGVYGAKMYTINELFNCKNNKKIALHSWDDVWGQIHG